MSRTRIIVAVSGLLWLVHGGVTLLLGSKDPGPALSDAIQLVLAGLLICAIADAARRSERISPDRAFHHGKDAGLRSLRGDIHDEKDLAGIGLQRGVLAIDILDLLELVPCAVVAHGHPPSRTARS